MLNTARARPNVVPGLKLPAIVKPKHVYKKRDNINVSQISSFIKHQSQKLGLQCIIISLKDTFYTKAQGLVGVYRDQEKESSGNVTLDLTKYDTSSTSSNSTSTSSTENNTVTTISTE